MPINSPELKKSSEFIFDFRVPKPPKLTNDHLEMFFLGEFNLKGSPCLRPPDKEHKFVETNDYLQVIVTERAVNCALDALT